MLVWLKKFLTDETAFVRIARGALLGLGALAVSGSLPPEVPEWLGAVGIAAGGLMGAGDKNPKSD